MSTPTNGLPPANWYPDPHVPGQLRYWDGQQWTDHTHTPEPSTGQTAHVQQAQPQQQAQPAQQAQPQQQAQPAQQAQPQQQAQPTQQTQPQQQAQPSTGQFTPGQSQAQAQPAQQSQPSTGQFAPQQQQAQPSTGQFTPSQRQQTQPTEQARPAGQSQPGAEHFQAAQGTPQSHQEAPRHGASSQAASGQFAPQHNPQAQPAHQAQPTGAVAPGGAPFRPVTDPSQPRQEAPEPTSYPMLGLLVGVLAAIIGAWAAFGDAIDAPYDIAPYDMYAAIALGLGATALGVLGYLKARDGGDGMVLSIIAIIIGVGSAGVGAYEYVSPGSLASLVASIIPG